jgi:hypothetical protein
VSHPPHAGVQLDLNARPAPDPGLCAEVLPEPIAWKGAVGIVPPIDRDTSWSLSPVPQVGGGGGRPPPPRETERSGDVTPTVNGNV